ncbi:DMT family transporter [Alcaligenaceae bacterium CGII-47]|nr:DMT family transporter [Alcaligenaceae bacterium CGII-47]
MMRSQTTSVRAGYFFAMMPPLFWAGNFFLARMAADIIPPIQMSFWRWLLALIILTFLTFPRWREHAPQIKKEVHFLAILGALGITAFNCLIYTALHHTTVINASIINTLMPVVTFVLALFIIGDRLGLRQAFGLGISITGAATIIFRGQFDQILQLSINKGDLLVICGVLCWAMYTVLIKWRPTALPALLFLTVVVALGVLFHLPLLIWEMTTVGGWVVNETAIATLLYLAVFPSLLAYIWWGRAVAMLGPGRTGTFMYAMPIFSTGLAALFLHEALYIYHLFGFLLVVAGVALATRPMQARTTIDAKRIRNKTL